MNGFLTKKVDPKCPKDIGKRPTTRIVLLKVVISREGDVPEVNVVSGDPLLVPAAADAVKRWKFRPYLLNGKPVEFESQLGVNFEAGR
jgi:periplasmic protein TonB